MCVLVYLTLHVHAYYYNDDKDLLRVLGVLSDAECTDPDGTELGPTEVEPDFELREPEKEKECGHEFTNYTISLATYFDGLGWLECQRSSVP